MTQPLPQPADPSLAQPTGDPTAAGGARVDQDTLTRLLAREKEQGGRAAVRKLLESLGFEKPDELTEFVRAQQDAKAAQLSEVERREKAAADAAASAAQREAAAAERERAAVLRAVLVSLGASGDDLADAERLLAVDDGADEQAVTEAAAALKARRPELFGGQQVLPPAPGGSPAGGPPPRGSGAAKPGQAGRDMARRRGFVSS